MPPGSYAQACRKDEGSTSLRTSSAAGAASADLGIMEVSPFLKENDPDWPLSPWQRQLSNEAGDMPLECVGSLQVQQKPQEGFLCGSLPVPTDTEAMSCRASSFAAAAIIPAASIPCDRVVAPQYRILPNQTDLNRLSLSEMQRDLVLPVASRRAPEGVHDLCKAWGNNYHMQPLARKCEALAVSRLARCGDQVDVIAPVEILKKIFKIPYSKARLSIAVHRVGQTLILNTGPDVDEGENVIRAKKSQAKAKEKSLFLKFAMQSVRAEACDCPVSNMEAKNPTNITSNSCSHVFNDFQSDLRNTRSYETRWNQSVNDLEKKTADSARALNTTQGHSRQDAKHTGSWSASGQRTSDVNSFTKATLVGEQQKDSHCFHGDSGNHKKPTSENFLRVLFWQLEDIKLLLGSDLLLFSNEKHLAVSLHLWETQQQVTPLMWLDAWLDNVMASVPELAICYHHNGIVQGYELIKTDDIFLLKGLSSDGTSFFHPHMVRQNAVSVLKFLQENCKQDLGTYWLFKNSGEDLVQLFDLSVISRDCSPTTKKEAKKDSLSSSWTRSRSRSKASCSLPLGILLYRLAHRLSLSQDPHDRRKCANFFKNCLELLGEQDHLFVRASAHEHVARLILKCYEELGSSLGPSLLEANESDENTRKQRVLTNSDCLPQIAVSDTQKTQAFKASIDIELTPESSQSDVSVCSSHENQEAIVGQEGGESHTVLRTKMEPKLAQVSYIEKPQHDLGPVVSPIVQTPSSMPETNLHSGLTGVALVQARLTAVHHVSQAIKALRWQRQHQEVESKVLTSDDELFGMNHHIHVVPVCIHGELDLIEYFDIRNFEIGPFRDSKLSQLVLLLGESYLALGLAYKAEGELNKALKAAELACSVYGSLPLHLLINMSHPSLGRNNEWVSVPTSPPSVGPTCMSSSPHSFCEPLYYDSKVGRHADKGSFWCQAWVLVGDIHVEYQTFSVDSPEGCSQKGKELSIAEEVLKEVKRLQKKLGQGQRGCGICSLTNCSCENDRANSNISASSSTSYSSTPNRKQRCIKKTNSQVAGNYTRRPQHNQLSDSDSSVLNLDRGRGFSELSCSSSVQNQRAQNMLRSGEGKSASTKVDGSGDTVNKVDGSGDTVNKQSTKGDIFSYIKSPKHTSRQENLVAALECYDAAMLVSENSEEMKSILRKKGWTYNETGRMKLASGNTMAAKVDFERAIGAFNEAKDQTNVVLIHCNMAHGLRAAAESLVSQLDSVNATGLFEHMSKKLYDDAISWYLDALRVYGLAKNGAKLLSEDHTNEKVSLVNEVLTQFAHTYLRLGMFLGRVEGKGHSAQKVPFEASNSEALITEAMHCMGPSITANDAIRAAIALYESLGSLRAQELAFAQYQLACHHKACCLATVKLEGKKPNNVILLQQFKRYLSLADRYWLKSLRYYKCSTHPDMFLEIQMQRSDLHVIAASTSNSLQFLEMALSYLLEARHVNGFQGMGSIKPAQHYLKPSEAVCNKFVQKLQGLLKAMLSMVHNSQKTSSSSSKSLKVQTKSCKMMEDKQKRENHNLDVKKLKELYRLSLKSEEMPDLIEMYDIILS